MNNRLRHLEKRPNHMDEKESIDIQQYHPGRIHFIFILYKIWNILSVSQEAFQKSLTFQYSYSLWRKIINHEMSKQPTLQKLNEMRKKVYEKWWSFLLFFLTRMFSNYEGYWGLYCTVEKGIQGYMEEFREIQLSWVGSTRVHPRGSFGCSLHPLPFPHPPLHPDNPLLSRLARLRVVIRVREPYSLQPPGILLPCLLYRFLF